MRAGIAIANAIKANMKNLGDDEFGRSLSTVTALLTVMTESVDECHLDEVTACLEAVMGSERLQIDPRAGTAFERATCTNLLGELEYKLKERKTALEEAHRRIRHY
ncbi:TPA: hypothetical protein DEB00_00350 [Candidatus Uhrbacteria bacterium]|nr:hypothetical protein [Candidatus Uhrbacteria bacterium]